MKMIRVEVNRVTRNGNDLLVLLRAEDRDVVLPILVDVSQAHAIYLILQNEVPERPLTHDLFKNVLETFNLKLIRIEVHDKSDTIFFARLVIEKDGKEFEIDARPSDAIALALRCGAQIMVAEDVMKAGVAVKLEPRKDPHAPQTPAQSIEIQLQKAIADERYEDAARLRDALKRMKEDKVIK